MARDWKKLASDIVELVGGESNITSVTHCITRLRFKLRDESIVDDKKVGQLEGVIQVIHANNQYQIVIGNHVGDVYDAVGALIPALLAGEVAADDGDAPKGSIVSRVIDVISGMFMPILVAFSAAGLMKAIAVMCSSFGWLATTDSTYIILNAMGQGMFDYLPIFLGYTAAKKFGSSPFMGMAVGAFLCSGDIAGLADIEGGATFFGIPVTLPDAGYLQSVIPVILACWLMSYVEKGFKKIVPDIVSGVFVPVLTLFVTCAVTLLVVGPISNAIASVIANALLAMLDVAPLIGGFLIALFWPVLIIFGMHWAFIPVIMSDIATLGYDVILPITVGTNFAIGFSCLAIFLKTKNAKIKETAVESTASALLAGITEPGIYGLVLKYKRPFIICIVSCAVCGAVAAVSHLTQPALFTTSLITLPAIYGAVGPMEIVSIVIASAGSFFGTYFFGFNDKMIEEEENVA